jgi:short-subunit dehydrogenase
MQQKIVITGATKGIGRAIAIKFARAGFDLALCSRNEKELETLKEHLLAIAGDKKIKILAIPCDVSRKEEVLGFAAHINEQFGVVDILINNAGVFTPGQAYNEADGVLEATMNANLYSAYHLTRALLPKMLELKQGHIFTLCSVASIKAYPNGGAYSISKYALLGFTKNLREELKNFGIKVTALIPGATYTDSWAASGLPEERFMKAEDIADIVWDIYHLSAGAVVEEVLLRPLLGDI